jgi:hypothetical protein
MSRQPETVIIYFARSANEDLKQNRFSGKGLHRRLIHRLHRHTLKTLRSSELPILTFTEDNQTGDNLAQRLANAFSQAFAEGYKNAIAVGNDTPDLDAKLLMQAADEMAAGSPVLGPSLDGGNYLIGLRKQGFNEATFCQALENNDETNSRLNQLLESHLELATLADIDDEKSLNAWLQSFSNEFEKILFRKEVKSTISNSSTDREYFQALTHRSRISEISYRGPPLAFIA